MARTSIKATSALEVETVDTGMTAATALRAGAGLATTNPDDLARLSAASLTIVGVESTR